MMKKLITLITMCLFLAMTGPTATAQENINVDATVSTIVQDWPEASKKVAMKMVKKYGAPDERTASRLIWYEKGGWNVTVLRRNPIDHDFPLPHKDVLYQNIEYDVPVEKFDELAIFDGSLIIEQTRGTLGVRCDRVAANYIAINLAHEIITDQISVEAARQKYGELIVMLMSGKQSPYYSGFIFDMPRGETAHSDEPVIPQDVIQSLMANMNKMSDMQNMNGSMNGMNDMNNDDRNMNMDMEVENMSNSKMSGNATQVGAAQSQKYGWYLVDGEGRTLYMFKADTKGQSSACYDQCAEAWPPLLAQGSTMAAASVVSEEMLGAIERRGGSMQVTYNGWPLYYYVEDQGQGQFTGQDLMGFGAEWYLVAPDGSYIHMESEGENMEGDDY